LGAAAKAEVVPKAEVAMMQADSSFMRISIFLVPVRGETGIFSVVNTYAVNTQTRDNMKNYNALRFVNLSTQYFTKFVGVA